jgi:hypothetical protein
MDILCRVKFCVYGRGHISSAGRLCLVFLHEEIQNSGVAAVSYLRAPFYREIYDNRGGACRII